MTSRTGAPGSPLGVVHDGRLLRSGTPDVAAIEAGDILLYIRQVTD